MSDSAILLPACAMVGLTFVTWIRLYRERIGEIRRRRIHPQKLATRRDTAELLEDTRASDHLRNLFEMPVLFYVLCAMLAATEMATPLFVVLAWLYFLARCVHAAIHLGYNNVYHRFIAYVAGTALLFATWALFAWQIATA
ncbi:MAG: MAPEG family protein [Halofilum sp. (in: g-proteobacteria)]|nr:MAPEG family protein [Halofilum sp. (in: g-proteobacteria)]